jgi:hypothetical protein
MFTTLRNLRVHGTASRVVLSMDDGVGAFQHE